MKQEQLEVETINKVVADRLKALSDAKSSVKSQIEILKIERQLFSSDGAGQDSPSVRITDTSDKEEPKPIIGNAWGKF